MRGALSSEAIKVHQATLDEFQKTSQVPSARCSVGRTVAGPQTAD